MWVWCKSMAGPHLPFFKSTQLYGGINDAGNGNLLGQLLCVCGITERFTDPKLVLRLG